MSLPRGLKRLAAVGSAFHHSSEMKQTAPKDKSPCWALALTLCFGPMGLFYTSVVGGAIMTLAMIIADTYLDPNSLWFTAHLLSDPRDHFGLEPRCVSKSPSQIFSLAVAAVLRASPRPRGVVK